MKKIVIVVGIFWFSILMAGCQQRINEEDYFHHPKQNSDSLITAAVQSTLHDNILLADLPLMITTENETVQLSGYVKTIRQSDVAEELASKVQGVKAVQNNLIVRKK